MSDILTRDLIAYDPLTDTTRKERRILLGVSALGIALVKVPLVPTKFSVFGIDFAPINQEVMLQLYALLVVYFLFAFLVYAFSDYVAWRRSQIIHHREYIRQDALVRKNMGSKTSKEVIKKFNEDGCPYEGFTSYRVAILASVLRAIFEFLVPVGISCYSIINILAYTP